MSQPPQGQPPYGPDGQPSGGGWGRQQPGQPQQPAPGWEQPQQPGQGREQPSGQPLQPGQGWGQQPGQPAPGGYGPPPGQGGWGAPSAPGYGEQLTQVGGFGVPGPPLNGGGPSAPGGGGNNKKNMIITAVAALVLVVVVAVLVALALRGNDEEDTTASSSPSTSSSPSSSGGFSAEPSDVADPADFIGQLPADFVDCTDMELEGDGDLAAASCGAALTQPGPQLAAFYLYPDVATLDEVFAEDVADQGLTEFAAGDTCSAGTGYGEWTYSDGTHGGQLACQLTGDGNVLITWTDDAFLTEGLIQAPGTSQAEVSVLYDWWMSVHSEYQD